jgi:hypothetical protein
MPRIKDSEELNDLNRAKKAVNRNNMRNFKGAEKAVVSGSTGKVADLFEELLKKLVDIRASLYEVNTTIDLVILPPPKVEQQKKKTVDRQTVADRFIEATSRLIVQSSDIRGFTVRKLKNNISYFSPAQIAELDSAFGEVNRNWDNLQVSIGEVQQAPDDIKLQFIGDKLSELNEEWERGFSDWIQTFDGLLKSYGRGGTDTEREVLGVLDEANVSDAGSEASSMSGSGYHLSSHHQSRDGFKIGDQRLYAPRRYL